MLFKKTIFSIISALFFITISLKAEIINGISVIVENEPITLFEIYKFSKIYNTTTKEALDVLIRQKLEINQIKLMNIEVSEYEISQVIDELAAKNKMDRTTFLNAVKAENINIDNYKIDLRKKIQRDKLYQYIFGTKQQVIGNEALDAYYNSNKVEFTKVDSFDVTRYQSKDEAALENPASAGVESVRLRLESMSTESKIINILTKTEIGALTPVMKNKDDYARFLVHTKNNESVLPFEQVKSMIMAKLSQDYEKSIINEYFEKLKSSAIITIIRLP